MGVGAVIVVTALHFVLLGIVALACDTVAPPPGREDFPCAVAVVQLHSVDRVLFYVLLAAPPVFAALATGRAMHKRRWRILTVGAGGAVLLSATIFAIFWSGLPR